jgi:hypothetical protein
MARGYLKWSVKDLSDVCGVSAATIKRMEEADGTPKAFAENVVRIQSALEQAGVQFIPENGGGAGIRARKKTGPTDEGIHATRLTSENTD